MLLTIHWCPELGIYRLSNGQRELIVTPTDIAPGERLAEVVDVFRQARKVVESGQAISGVSVNL